MAADAERTAAQSMHWDLTRLYASEKDWTEDCGRAAEDMKRLASFAGKLADGESAVLGALYAQSELEYRLERLYTFAMMRLHEDTTRGESQARMAKAASLVSSAEEAGAFLVPELLNFPEETLLAYSQNPAFSDYDVFLRDLARRRSHILGTAEERILAMATEITRVPETASELLSNADLNLGTIRDENGKRVQLTDAGYMRYLTSGNRAVRRQAWKRMMQGYDRMGNTFAALYAGQVKADCFMAKARGFDTCRSAALFPDQVPERVYDNLIQAVHGGLDALAAYLDEKRNALHVKQLHLYDLYCGVTSGFEIAPSFGEAFSVFLEAVKPLGDDYTESAARALKEGWIDVYPAKGKRSGAYSTGVYGYAPYVLMNYTPDYDGLTTLCHEMGHAMHSYYSDGAQPYAKSHYRIFVAEVASTTNEVLLNEYLQKKYRDNPAAQAMLIGRLLELFRTTVFRQTMFAEFEMLAHTKAERGESLTRESLNAIHLELNRLYYGKACRIDDAIASEWMRIPHFYSPYYVYQYAIGFSAAVLLARGILSGDREKTAAYRRFLTLGGSMPPIEELKVAGVDMASPETVCEALDYFAELLLRYRTCLEATAQTGERRKT